MAPRSHIPPPSVNDPTMDTNPPQNDAVLPEVFLLRPPSPPASELTSTSSTRSTRRRRLTHSSPSAAAPSGPSSAPSVFNAETLDLLPSLELVVVSSAGLEHVELPYCGRRAIAVTNASAMFCEDRADYAVAMLIDVMRRVSHGDRFVRAGPEEVPPGFQGSGDARKKALLDTKTKSPSENNYTGFDRFDVATDVSAAPKKARGKTGRHCWAWEYRLRDCETAGDFRMLFNANVHDLAVNSKILVLCCALTEGTHHIVDKDVISAHGKGGVIINVGRGALVDEKGLVQRLVRGEIGSAGVNVFEKEPKALDELFALDNVALSPHHAVMTPESFEAAQEPIIGNLRAFFSNEPLSSLVQYE